MASETMDGVLKVRWLPQLAPSSTSAPRNWAAAWGKQRQGVAFAAGEPFQDELALAEASASVLGWVQLPHPLKYALCFAWKLLEWHLLPQAVQSLCFASIH